MNTMRIFSIARLSVTACTCEAIATQPAGRFFGSSSVTNGKVDDKPARVGRPIVGGYTPVTKALWMERLKQRGSPSPGSTLPPIVDKAPEPVSITYAFTTDPEMLEMYRNPWNGMRIGRVLEDLDSLAGNIAFTHCDDGNAATMPPLLVTAAVEKIQLLQPIELSSDVSLSGQVVYTGSSSMDIRLSLQQASSTQPHLVAMFTFVARDPGTGKATRVNPLVATAVQDVLWYEECKAAAVARKAARASRVATGGADGEAGTMAGKRKAWAGRMLEEAQSMMLMPGLAAGDAVAIDATRLSNTFTCQPQQRNIHGRIFGGFLMRRAYELAFATTHLFAGRRPRFIQVERVDFKRPVDVGDLVTFRSRVLHTRNLLEHPEGARGHIFVAVEALINRPEEASSATTNNLTLMFEVDLREGHCVTTGGAAVRQIKRVLPTTPGQATLVEQFYPTHYDLLEA